MNQVNNKVKSMNSGMTDINNKLDSINKEVAKYLYDTCIIDVDGLDINVSGNTVAIRHGDIKYKINGTYFVARAAYASFTIYDYPSWIIVTDSNSGISMAQGAIAVDTDIPLFHFTGVGSYEESWRREIASTMAPNIGENLSTVVDSIHDDIYALWNETETINNGLSGKAPNNHRSSGTAYGLGNASYYGHVKLSDSYTSTSSTSNGIAATPNAVKSAIDNIKTLTVPMTAINGTSASPVDFNNITTDGFYDISGYIKNYPYIGEESDGVKPGDSITSPRPNSKSWLVILNGQNGNITQIYICDSEMLIRYRYQSNGYVWSPWKRMMNDAIVNNIESPDSQYHGTKLKYVGETYDISKIKECKYGEYLGYSKTIGGYLSYEFVTIDRVKYIKLYLYKTNGTISACYISLVSSYSVFNVNFDGTNKLIISNGYSTSYTSTAIKNFADSDILGTISYRTITSGMFSSQYVESDPTSVSSYSATLIRNFTKSDWSVATYSSTYYAHFPKIIATSETHIIYALQYKSANGTSEGADMFVINYSNGAYRSPVSFHGNVTISTTNSSSPSIITTYTHNTDIYIYIDGKLYKCSGVSVNNIYTFDFEIIRNYMTWITSYDESTNTLCIYFHNSKNDYNRAHLLNTNTNSVILAINVYYKYEASSIHSVPYLYNGELYAASEISPYGSIFGERLYHLQSVNISNPDKVNLNDIIFSDDFYVKDGHLYVSSNGDKTGYFTKYKIV